MADVAADDAIDWMYEAVCLSPKMSQIRREFGPIVPVFSEAEGVSGEYQILTSVTKDVIWPIDTTFAIRPKPGMDRIDIVRGSSASTGRLVVKTMRADTRSGGILSYKSSSGPSGFDDPRAAVVAGLAMTQRYHWTVDVQIDDGPALRLWTDPVGAREIFRLRDIPPGKQRRTALRHWVREHWRQRDRDPVKVKTHFRGAEAFDWNGFGCVITPSAFDQQRFEVSKASS